MSKESLDYDKNISAKRLQELHEEVRIKEGLKRLPGAEIARRIEAKTGFKMGGNTYNSHEDPLNPHKMTEPIARAIAEFYGVSTDYIYGFSDSRQHKTDNIVSKYGLSDGALHKLNNIKVLDKMQKRENPDAPSHMDIINELFESSEFQYFIDTIREAIIFRQKINSLDIRDSEKNKEKLARSLTEEQISYINNGGIKLLSTHNNSDYINFELQQAALNIVKDIIDSIKYS